MASPASAGSGEFTIAVLPDTQYYLDYQHQKSAGFPFDASEMFLDQARYIAAHSEAEGGDIAFVTSVGDVWDHQSLPMDPDHIARGFKIVPSAMGSAPTPEVLRVEIPIAKAGFDLIAGKVPFSVVPGNHDFDAQWLAKGPSTEPGNVNPIGVFLSGGLDNFRSLFGDQSPYFKGQPWYVASHDGGVDSAQIFTAGGYQFLHIGLQFEAPDASLEWAASVIRRHPGMPTIITTHDFLSNAGTRTPSPTTNDSSVDPRFNSAQQIWDKFISKNDQIFLVLCGHQAGQNSRTDLNGAGHKVYQILADYQERGQTRIDAGLAREGRRGIGDGWFRLMTFDMTTAKPTVHVRTYSPYYRAFSVDAPQYARWYRQYEKPALSDAEFLKQDDFQIDLDDFRARFGAPKNSG